MRHILALVLVLCVCAAGLADWPQFLGPDRTGISPETVKLAKTWPEGGPEVLWKIDVGPGYGGAAILGNEVFIMDRDAKGENDVLRCLSLADGSELWRSENAASDEKTHPGSRTIPAVDDKRVFIVGTHGDFQCIDRTTHKVLWQKNLVKDFDGRLPQLLVATSPLLYKDCVVVVACGKKAGIIACKRDTGEIAWQSETCGNEQFMSAKLLKIDGVDQIVGYGNSGKVTNVLSVDASTGKTLWKFDKWFCDTVIASPIHVGDGKVFITGGYSAGSVMIQVTKKEPQWSVAELWRLDGHDCGSQIHDPLLWDGHLFVDNNENGKQNGMVCVGLDGKVAWTSNSPKCDRGGQIIADGMIYKLDGYNNGELLLIEPTAESFKIVARAKVLAGKQIWAPPAISEGKLIIRDQTQMKCLDVK